MLCLRGRPEPAPARRKGLQCNGVGRALAREGRARRGPARAPRAGVGRNLRIAAVPLIPKFVDALKAAATELLERIDQAQKIAESLG